MPDVWIHNDWKHHIVAKITTDKTFTKVCILVNYFIRLVFT